MFIIQLLLTAGLSFIFAALSVLFRDVPQLLNHMITFGFFLAPIVYVLESVNDTFKRVVVLNPVTHIIVGWHNALFFDHLRTGRASVPPVSPRSSSP